MNKIFSAVLLCATLAACGGGGGNGGGGDTTDPVITNPTPAPSPIPTTSPVVTPVITPVVTPVITPVVTPIVVIPPTPVVTPVITPVVTPVITPVVTPVITPIVTPVVTPVITPVITPAPLTITSENAVELTASAATTILKTEIPVATEIASILTSIVSRNSNSIDHTELLKVVLDTNAGNQSKTSFPAEPIDCEVNGSLGYSGKLASANSLSAGDSINLTFNECSNQSGVETDGDIRYQVNLFTGSLLPENFFSLSYLMDLDFEYQDGNQDITITGRVNTGMSQDGDEHTTSLQAASLVINVDGNQRVIEDFNFIQIFDESTGILSLQSSGRLTSDELGGTLNFNTDRALLIQAGNENPTAGVLTLTNETGASVSASVIGGGMVNITVDSNGDGVAEDLFQVTWSNIENFFSN